MENFDKIKWHYNATPISADEKLNFYYSFSDCDMGTKDVLYCHLNEIEPSFLDNTEDLDNLNIKTLSDEIIDPRNSKKIYNLINDFSEKGRFLKRSEFFRNFPQCSTLTRKEHSACLQFLKAKRQRSIPNIDDIKIFNETKDKREKEYNGYLNFVKNHLLANPGTSFKSFEILYRKFLDYFIGKINLLDIFTISTGLPTLHSIVTTEDISWQCHPTLTYINGYFPKFKEYFDMYKIRMNIENYLKNLDEFVLYPQSNYTSNVNLDYDLKISEQALVLLFSVCNETDYESEIPLTIENNKVEIMQPLPSRYINQNTNMYVFDILFRNFLNESHRNSFKKFHNEAFIIENAINAEIDAINLDQTYKIQPIEKFLHKKNAENFLSSLITSKIILNEHNNDLLNILIDFKNVGFLNDNDNMVNLSCKLEYKKQFGLENMTFTELITEYIRANFIPDSSTIRYRIDAETFEVLHSSKITRSEITTELMELYNVNVSSLLNKLYKFINILQNFPDGKYLLKYNPKFNNQFLLYNRKVAQNAKTLSIQSLFKDCGLVVQRDFIPLDNMLCIRVIHEKLNIIPGCFPPWGKKKKSVINNDREQIVKKAQNKKESLEKSIQLKKKARKRIAKKAREIKRRQQNRQTQNVNKVPEVIDEVQTMYADLLIEKYANTSLNKSQDYFALKHEEKNVTKANEEFDLEKYLLDAAGTSNCSNNITRDEYLETKKAINKNFLNSSEIELRKAKLELKSTNPQLFK